MENKTLNQIQNFSRFAKVLCKIIYIFCIVGAVGCLVGIVSLNTAGVQAFKLGGEPLMSIIERSAKVSVGTLYAVMTVGLILCIGEFAIAKIGCNYFTHELAAGTPFTLEGAKEMLRFGIMTIVFSIGSLAAADVTYKILNRYMADIADMHLDGFGQAGMGITFILVSLLCKYGAEREQTADVRYE